MLIRKEEIISDIHELIKIIRKASSVDEYKYARCNVFLLLDLYKNLYHEEYKVHVPQSTLLEVFLSLEEKSFEQVYREEYLSDRQTHDSVANTITKIMSKYNLPNSIKQSYISSTDYMDIIWGFLNSFDSDLKDKLTKLIDEQHIDLFTTKMNKDCETDNIFMLDKSYVTVNMRHDVEGMLKFVHELAHAYAHSLMQDKEAAYNEWTSYYEFYSSFVERMMIRYLIDNNILSEDAIKSNKKFFKQLELYSSDIVPYKNYTKNEVNRHSNKLASSMVYMYGEYLSLIKEHDYMEDKEGTLEQVKEYLTSQGIASKEESLEILGIDREELVSGKKLQRVLNKNNM